MIFETFCCECGSILAISKDIPLKDYVNGKALESAKKTVNGCVRCNRSKWDPRFIIGVRPSRADNLKAKLDEIALKDIERREAQRGW